MKLSLTKAPHYKIETNDHNFSEICQHYIEDLFYQYSVLMFLNVPLLKRTRMGAGQVTALTGPLWASPASAGCCCPSHSSTSSPTVDPRF